MTENRDDLIRDLVADLRPVERPGRIGRSLAGWLALAGSYSVLVLLATGPLREGALGNLVRFPAFGLESAVALAAIASLAHAALRSAIPDTLGWLARLGLPAGLTLAWVSFYVVGFWAPAHPVSGLGMRNHCLWQTVLFSIPSLALMLWLARRLMPLTPRITGTLAGAAAAAIPGALMQIGCMYDPGHILVAHLSPVAIMAVAGAVIAPWALNARRTVPRGRGVPMH